MVCLYLRFPKATWVEDEKLGPGIAKILPKYQVWGLDKAEAVKVERYGFCIASDFSGTASTIHWSFQTRLSSGQDLDSDLE